MHEGMNEQVIAKTEKVVDYKSAFEKVLLSSTSEEIIKIASNYQNATIDQLFLMINEYNTFGYSKKLEYFLVEILKNTQRLMFKDYICLEEIVLKGDFLKGFCISKAANILGVRSEIQSITNQC